MLQVQNPLSGNQEVGPLEAASHTGIKKKKTFSLTFAFNNSTVYLVNEGYNHWVCFVVQIVHLKRFQFVNGRWIKSQKIVKFPRESFNPSAFLAPREAQSTWSLQSQSDCLVEELQKLAGGDSSVSSIATTSVVSPPISGKGLSLDCLLHQPYATGYKKNFVQFYFDVKFF